MEPYLLSVLHFSCILIFLPYCVVVSAKHANAQEFVSNVAVNCGSKSNSTAFDGREWIGESTSAAISGQSRSSVVVAGSFLGVDHVPYMTSRISASPFHFTFQVNPGQKFIRFHFYPALYHGFEKFVDLFTVNVGPFTLLDHFSATLASSHLGVKYFVKEFCLNVEEHGKLRITFSPSKSKESKNQMVYAFVNGIEIISVQDGLYYTPEGDLGAPIVGQRNRFYGIDNSTALEMVQRLNIGGNFISPVEDFGMFRRWNADASYFLESGVSLMNYLAPKLAYTNVPLLIAPPKFYQTSWRTTKTLSGNKLHTFTWKLPINLGFGYLVRLHFCDPDAAMTDGEQKEFSILINNHVAEKNADVLRWSDGTGFPVYKDYVAMMKGDRGGSESHLFVVIQLRNGLALDLFKGLEMFRLSNLENCLATPEPASLKVLTTWNLNILASFSLFSLKNVFGTYLTIIILILITTVYHLSIIWEDYTYNENDTESVGVEPSGRHFSLADIRSATNGFSDAFVIGQGGFGKVYKGLLSGFPEIVAIKRLSSFSKQGAREFWTEIEVLSKLRHFNLVPLIGYCNENAEMILIYEYIPGGTLADNLYKFVRKGKECALLSWEQRLRICIGAARGLEYLHTGSESGIIHRDVKDTNILLGENFIPKIADFGLSKLEELTQSKTHISTHIKGTRGYLDPNYCSTHKLTRKSDVYSFGIVMLVVLSGRPALETKNLGDHENVLACFLDCVSKDEFDKIVDPRICESISPESLKEFVKSVDKCLQQGPRARPTMSQLVGSLELVLQLQERPIASTSGDVALEARPMGLDTIEESVVSLPSEGQMWKETPLREVPNRVRKPNWIWPWKTGQSRAPWVPGGKESGGAQWFSYDEMKKATHDFSDSNVIGSGSYGKVHRGILPNGQVVAVKRLRKGSMQGGLELRAKMEILARVHHKNLVGFVGFCINREQILVQELMSNGTLRESLSGKSGIFIDWKQRLQIALGSARGLEYLHALAPPIIHMDVKSANILLDKNLTARVADFGLSKLVSTQVFGTMAYLDPEYYVTGQPTDRSDVYSFGVVMLELVTGKQPMEKGKYIVREVRLALDRTDGLGNMMDPIINKTMAANLVGVHEFVDLALNCVEESASLRPTMSDLVKEIKTIAWLHQ